MKTQKAITTVLAVGMFLALNGAVQAGLVTRAYYSFDEVVDADGSGGYTFNSTDYYADLSGSGHNALLKKESTVTADNPIGTTAKFGNSFRTAGPGGGSNNHTYTSTAHTADLNFTGDDNFTFSLWTYANYEQSFQRGFYFGKADIDQYDLANASQGYAFYRAGGNNNTNHRWTVNDTTGPENFTLPNDGSDQWDNDEWALWTITFDGTTNELKGYVNGSLQMTNTVVSTDWANNEPLVIAGRMGEHQRAFVWPAVTSGDGFIDDFAALASTLTGPEVLALFNLAENGDLGYAYGAAEKLLSAHRDAGSVEIGGVQWSFAAGGFTGGEGVITGSAGNYQLLLNAGQGTGLIGTPAGSGGGQIPEPATMCALGMALAGLGGYVKRRRKLA